MERIELFDGYINNQLSDAQRSEFDARLKSDEDFASDFKVYLMTVDGICREAHQDSLDFGMAMRHLSKERLKEIVGQRDTKGKVVSSKDRSGTILRFKLWMWQVASIAVIVIIVFNIQRQFRNAIYDDIYASAQFEDIRTRGVTMTIDISKLDDLQLEATLPIMEKNYKNSEDIDELYLTGYLLAMAYIRLHQPQPALEILNNLMAKLQDQEDYDFEVREMRLIINLLN